MASVPTPARRHSALLAERLVRYSELRPCTTAFVDTRTPGSAGKENFTIIGPGVAENPEQHVHIEIPHGFNIGGARQPPGCINSQHSHETAEVFVVHSGTWAFLLGPNKEDGKVVLGPGDTISIPVRLFRGFMNVGTETGFLFAVLGGDDPGNVTWAPDVFDSARKYGLVLLEDGSLIDTTKGEKVPAGKCAMKPTTKEDLAAFEHTTAEEMGNCVLSHDGLLPPPTPGLVGLREFPIIGAANPAEQTSSGYMNWPHGFQLRHITIDPQDSTKRHVRHEEEVIMMHKGSLTVDLPSGQVDIGPGDVLTVPVDMPRSFTNQGDSPVEAYFVRGGDSPKSPSLVR